MCYTFCFDELKKLVNKILMKKIKIISSHNNIMQHYF